MSIHLLESRQLMSTSVSPDVTILASGSSVTGYTPSQITTGYGLAGLTFGTVSADGAGQTIAIVDAYNDPNIQSDLATFDTEFGLARADLTVVNSSGSSNDLPTTDASWAQEISLDVEWAHAVAPGAKILLVEATSDSTDDLMAAVDYARNATGVSVVTMSWGTSEFSTETSYDSDFTTPTGHTNVTFIAAAGDNGSSSGAEWPAAAAGVVSVGGTTLTLSSSGTYESETGWSDGGGGTSAYEGEAAFQYAAQRTGFRTVPDVSWDASTSTGMAVYDSLSYDNQSGWLEFGGTSAGAPQWGALVAIADQGRATDGASTLDGATNVLPTLYGLYAHKSLYSADFNDITSGSTSFDVSAGTGYDEVSGIGTPKGSELVAALVKETATIALKQTTVTQTGPVTGGPGRPRPRGGYELSLEVLDPTSAESLTAALFITQAESTTAAALPPPPTVSPGAMDVALATTTAAMSLAKPSFSPVDGTAGDLTVGASTGSPDIVAALPGVAATAAVEMVPLTAARVVQSMPLPADFVAAGVPPLPAAAVPNVPAVDPSAQPSHEMGWGAAVTGAAVALWVATEPARARRREAAVEGTPLQIRQLVVTGLFRG